MESRFLVQTPAKSSSTLDDFFYETASSGAYDEMLIAVAYATVAGIRKLLAGIPAATQVQTRWLVGLDDYITQPGAIRALMAMPGAQLKVASYASGGLRFHPKVYIFRRAARPKAALAVIGSSNLTAQALSGNGEANAVLTCERAQDHAQLQQLWDALWVQGRDLSQQELAAYELAYERNRPSRPLAPAPLPGTARTRPGRTRQLDVLATDDAELDPSTAELCWIECGNITGMGREIEFKAEQGLFFGLSPTGGTAHVFSFVTSAKDTVPLRMKYQANHMWRLQLNNSVPEFAAGLRPRLRDGSLGRSPHVALIRRTDRPGVFTLRFILLDSPEFRRIVARSRKRGTFGQTSARQYGWC